MAAHRSVAAATWPTAADRRIAGSCWRRQSPPQWPFTRVVTPTTDDGFANLTACKYIRETRDCRRAGAFAARGRDDRPASPANCHPARSNRPSLQPCRPVQRPPPNLTHYSAPPSTRPFALEATAHSLLASRPASWATRPSPKARVAGGSRRSRRARDMSPPPVRSV